MLTQARLKELLRYDPFTGVLTWKVDKGNRKAGSVAGTTPNNRREYVEIRIDGVLYKAHRLAWLYTYGAFPKKETDHIKHDGRDNKITSLREVTRQQNQKNRSKQCNNTSGVCGVRSRDGKWLAYIGGGKNYVRLGLFIDFDEAVRVRKTAEAEHGYHPNHGKLY